MLHRAITRRSPAPQKSSVALLGARYGEHERLCVYRPKRVGERTAGKLIVNRIKRRQAGISAAAGHNIALSRAAVRHGYLARTGSHLRTALVPRAFALCGTALSAISAPATSSFTISLLLAATLVASRVLALPSRHRRSRKIWQRCISRYWRNLPRSVDERVCRRFCGLQNDAVGMVWWDNGGYVAAEYSADRMFGSARHQTAVACWRRRERIDYIWIIKR